MKKNIFLASAFALFALPVFIYPQCTGKPTVVPPVVVDSTAIATADSISRNWWCASITAPDESEQRAISLLGKAWPTGSVIRVKYFLGTPAQRAWPDAAFKEIERFVNLKFEVVSMGNADLRISFDNSGAWSVVGTDAKSRPQSSATTNLGWPGMDVALHEVLHFLSFGHEQSSPMSGICWDKPVVYADLAKPPNGWTKEMVDRNVFFKYTFAQVDTTDFDPTSIMEYQIPALWTCNKIGIPGGKVLSELDRFMLGKIYPGKVPPLDPPSGVTLTPTQRNEIVRLLNKSKGATDAAKVASDSANVLVKKIIGF